MSGLGFGRPKPIFPMQGGKNPGKTVFPGFWTVFTAQNWEKPQISMNNPNICFSLNVFVYL
jgi:hypothetical protein